MATMNVQGGPADPWKPKSNEWNSRAAALATYLGMSLSEAERGSMVMVDGFLIVFGNAGTKEIPHLRQTVCPSLKLIEFGFGFDKDDFIEAEGDYEDGCYETDRRTLLPVRGSWAMILKAESEEAAIKACFVVDDQMWATVYGAPTPLGSRTKEEHLACNYRRALANAVINVWHTSGNAYLDLAERGFLAKRLNENQSPVN